MIKIYSTPTCHYCKELKKFLEAHDVEFESIDVSQNRDALKEMVEKTGQMGVPVSEINGEVVIGFDRERVASLLGISE